MNKLVLLPGNSSSNSVWLDKVAQTFITHYGDIYKHEYLHWENNKKIIDFEAELQVLAQNIVNSECLVLAKSAGSLLAIQAINKRLINPKRCVFVGFPVRWALEQGIDVDSLLEKYYTKTLIIQNSNDPITDFAEVSRYLGSFNNKNFDFIRIEGNDHKYENLESIKNKVVQFLIC